MAKRIRNPVAVAMRKRHAQTTTVMRDRRRPRGGSRDRQKEILADGW